MTHNLIVGNCLAMSKPIPGTPADYNTHLDLFCRAGNTAILINVPDSQPAIFQNNIMYSNNQIALEVEYPGDPSSVATIKYDNNIFIGFPNAEGRLPTPIYSNSDLKMFTHPGASFSNNVTYHANPAWKCPATSLHEVNGSCADPHLKDMTWHSYGHGDASRMAGAHSEVVPVEPELPQKSSHVSVAAKSIGVVVLGAGAWMGLRYLRSRGTNA